MRVKRREKPAVDIGGRDVRGELVGEPLAEDESHDAGAKPRPS